MNKELKLHHLFQTHELKSVAYLAIFRILIDKDGSPITHGDLAKDLRVSTANVTGLIDSLQERGLVQRNTPSNDRRVSNITLTYAGRSFWEKLSSFTDDEDTPESDS